ncbi:hypothetical protein [Thalassotalea euphylliae]|nr:hypothetical protein [Thalassotalea euphylliae]
MMSNVTIGANGLAKFSGLLEPYVSQEKGKKNHYLSKIAAQLSGKG